MKSSRQWPHAISGRVSKPVKDLSHAISGRVSKPVKDLSPAISDRASKPVKGICHMLLVAGRQNLLRDIAPGIIIGVSQIDRDLDSMISGSI